MKGELQRQKERLKSASKRAVDSFSEIEFKIDHIYIFSCKGKTSGIRKCSGGEIEIGENISKEV